MPEANRAASGLLPLALAALLLLPAAAIHAADGKGQFAVRGAALLRCAQFVRARETRSEGYRVIASWVDGYITATNQHMPGTYDALSFEGPELLMALMDSHCRKHPEDPVMGVVSSLVEQRRGDRLTQQSARVKVKVGAREGELYVELIRRMQQKLRDGGFYKGPVDGSFSGATIEAVRAYQKKAGFQQTGFPDQSTLWSLMRAPAAGK